MPGFEGEVGQRKDLEGREEATFSFGLASDDNEVNGLRFGDGFEDGQPVFERPGFMRGTAAGVEDKVGGRSDRWQVWRPREMGGGMIEEEGEFFEGAGELGRGGALTRLDPVGALDQSLDAEAFEIAAEVAIGIEKVTDDQIEGVQVIDDFL